MARTIEINSPIVAVFGILFIVVVMGGMIYFIRGQLDWISYTMLGIVALGLSLYAFRSIGTPGPPQQPPQYGQQQYPQQPYQQYPPRYPPYRR